MKETTWKDVALELIGVADGVLIGGLAAFALFVFPVVMMVEHAGNNDALCVDGYLRADVRIEGEVTEMISVNPSEKCKK